MRLCRTHNLAKFHSLTEDKCPLLLNIETDLVYAH